MENKIKNSEMYLNSVLGKENGFSVPKNYFNGIEEQFSSFLFVDKVSKKPPLSIPSSYFDTLEDTIIAKVSSEEKTVKVVSFKERVLKIIPFVAAASIVLFIGINSFNFNKNKENIFEKIADSDIENWISNNINLISDDDIDLAYNSVEFDYTETIPNSISNEELENYLSNQNDLSLILEND